MNNMLILVIDILMQVDLSSTMIMLQICKHMYKYSTQYNMVNLPFKSYRFVLNSEIFITMPHRNVYTIHGKINTFSYHLLGSWCVVHPVAYFQISHMTMTIQRTPPSV